jgi:UDP-N-acetylmuramoyl-tripeptide--D-alanyl-D-alanine ligase
LGSDARSYHQEVGEHAQTMQIDDLLTLGVLSQNSSDAFNKQAINQNNQKGHHFSERNKLMSHLKTLLANEQQQISILVKGSRSAHMEYVVKDITEYHAEQSRLITSTITNKGTASC